MGKELENFLHRQGEQGPIRQRPDFREAKHALRRLYKEHVESTGQGNKSIHPAQQRRQNSQQQFDEHEGYSYTVHPRTGWRYYPSSSSSSSSQWQQHNEWKSNQSWDHCEKLKVEIISIGKFVASRQEMIPTNSFLSSSGSCFSLAGNFQFPGNQQRV